MSGFRVVASAARSGPAACAVRLARRYSTASFTTDLGIPRDLSERLETHGVAHPNHVQRTCLPEVLRGRNAVINAETGSGKTLCFLLPILQSLVKHRSCVRKAVPQSLILVPTPDLAKQIDSVYQSLADSEWGSSVVHRGSPLSLKSSTLLVIGTPSAIVQYDLSRLLRGVEVLCFDEADMLLVGGESQAAWDVLGRFKKLHQEDGRREGGQAGRHGRAGGSERRQARSTPPNERDVSPDSDQSKVLVSDSVHSEVLTSDSGNSEVLPLTSLSRRRQMIFTAATLPSGGRKTVHSLLKQALPRDTLFFTTDHTHHLVPTVENEFVYIESEVAASQPCEPVKGRVLDVRLSQLCFDLARVWKEDENYPKVLIFVNTVAAADKVLDHLTSNHTLSSASIAPHSAPPISLAMPPHTVSLPSVATPPHTAPLPSVATPPHTVPPPSVAMPPHTAPLPSVATPPHTAPPPSEATPPHTAPPPSEATPPHIAPFPWWEGRVAGLHKGVPPEDRERFLAKFCSGELSVLVCTDLGSRGLDLPGVAIVVQFDFPGNSADYLHRAGRTGRAGAAGQVLSYVQRSDIELAFEIKKVISDKQLSFASIFSRNKMLRRKIKSRKKKCHDNIIVSL